MNEKNLEPTNPSFFRIETKVWNETILCLNHEGQFQVANLFFIGSLPKLVYLCSILTSRDLSFISVLLPTPYQTQKGFFFSYRQSYTCL